MLKKTIHLISGLPRSGSTLLANLLAQNPRFQATASSGILDVLFNVRNIWDTLGEFRAMPPAASEAAKLPLRKEPARTGELPGRDRHGRASRSAARWIRCSGR